MKPRDLQQLSLGVDDTLLLDDGDAFALTGGSSPLALLSPKPRRPVSPARTKPAAGGAAAGSAAARQLGLSPAAAGADEQENEPLGELPRLGRRKAGTGARRAPDARRQSLAIGAMFASLTHSEGLLGDSELAVGDEEVQVPLAKSGKLLGGAANHSSLFCDPDTDDLLDTQLPSPLINGAAPAGGGSSAQPVFCDSPQLDARPGRQPGAFGRRTPGAALSSMAALGSLREACAAGRGLDDIDAGDLLLLQEDTKPSEAAAAESSSTASLTVPVCSGSQPAAAAAQPAAEAVRGGTGTGASSSSSSSLRSGGERADELAAIRQRLQQFQLAAPKQQPAEAQPPAQQQQAPQPQRPLPPPPQQAQLEPAAVPPTRELAAAPSAAAHDGPAGEPAPAAGADSAAHPASAPTEARGAAAAAHAQQQAEGQPQRVQAPKAAPQAAARPAGAAAASRLPAAPVRRSRLRAPTTSSSYFSNAATDSRQPAGAAHAVPSGSRAVEPARAARPAERPLRAGGAGAAAAAASAAAKPAALSRVAQSSSLSRIPTPSKPSVAAPARVAGAPAAGPEHVTPQGSPVRLPAINTAAGVGPDCTPNTARLRWLEQNPELAFGGGTKLAASPIGAHQQQRKLTAEERHRMEWGDHL